MLYRLKLKELLHAFGNWFGTKTAGKNRTAKQISGAKAEGLAADYLCQRGIKIIERNVKTYDGRKRGEVDLLCMDGDLMVFVEVRYRNVRNVRLWQSAGASITPSKKKSMQQAARHLMSKLGIVQARIDAIIIDEGKEIVWVKNIV